MVCEALIALNTEGSAYPDAFPCGPSAPAVVAASAATAAVVPVQQLERAGGSQEDGGNPRRRRYPAGHPRTAGGHRERQRCCQVTTGGVFAMMLNRSDIVCPRCRLSHVVAGALSYSAVSSP